MSSTQTEPKPLPQMDLIWEAGPIGAEIGVSPRVAYHLLENGHIPGKKVGRKWCASRAALQRHFAMGEVA